MNQALKLVFCQALFHLCVFLTAVEMKHVPIFIVSGASAGASTGFSSPATTESVFGIGDKFKKPEGAWECEVCLVQNKAADVQCIACQASKAGAKLEPKGTNRF